MSATTEPVCLDCGRLHPPTLGCLRVVPFPGPASATNAGERERIANSIVRVINPQIDAGQRVLQLALTPASARMIVDVLRENAALAPAEHKPIRWNVEQTDAGFRICRGDHSRSDDCEWEEFVPAPAEQDAPTVTVEWPAREGVPAYVEHIPLADIPRRILAQASWITDRAYSAAYVVPSTDPNMVVRPQPKRIDL